MFNRRLLGQNELSFGLHRNGGSGGNSCYPQLLKNGCDQAFFIPGVDPRDNETRQLPHLGYPTSGSRFQPGVFLMLTLLSTAWVS